MALSNAVALATVFAAVSASPLVPLVPRANFPATIQFLGNYTPNPDDYTFRDLGFSGKLGSTIISSFGDTFQCTDATMTDCLGPLANSAGVGLNQTTFRDSPDPDNAAQFCKYNTEELNNQTTYGLGITNVVSDTSSTVGILYFLLIRRQYTDAPPVGAGAAQITLDSNGDPVCNRLADTWWGPDEPFWGDHSAFQDPQGQFIYNVGGCSPNYNSCKSIFVSRVPVGQATDLSQYRYWNGTAFSPDRIYGLSQYALQDTTGQPITDGGQGQIAWNNHLNAYIYLYNPGESTQILIRTPSQPQGPWSTASVLFDAVCQGACSDPQFVYSPSIAPWFYDSDQTIDVEYTCYPHGLRSVQVQFT